MVTSIQKLSPKQADFPKILATIDQPPEQLFVMAQAWSDLLDKPKVAIVGSRKVSTYGKEVTRQLAADLARAGVVIVSGLAIGVDSIAHQAALEVGGLTLAVLPSGLSHIYPASHTRLAQQIVAQGGALVSEYNTNAHPQKWFFVERNRLVSGLSHALVVTEAAEKSGTLHTANFALDQGREVFAVPGNITSPLSKGTNNLIRIGATPAISASDILNVLGLQTVKKAAPHSSDPYEQAILSLIGTGVRDGAMLLQQSDLNVQQFNQALTMLEIKGVIAPGGNNTWQYRS